MIDRMTDNELPLEMMEDWKRRDREVYVKKEKGKRMVGETWREKRGAVITAKLTCRKHFSVTW